MGNQFTAGDQYVSLSNGATEVFVEVLTLAVSDLVEDPWDYRFAALLTLQDQNVLGRGAVGFALEDIDWGPTPRRCARAKDFVLRATGLALTRHRWDELGYDPPLVENRLRRFQDLVESYVPLPGPSSGQRFPAPDEGAMASCVRHRVLNGLPLWTGCVFCTRPPE